MDPFEMEVIRESHCTNTGKVPSHSPGPVKGIASGSRDSPSCTSFSILDVASLDQCQEIHSFYILIDSGETLLGQSHGNISSHKASISITGISQEACSMDPKYPEHFVSCKSAVDCFYSAGEGYLLRVGGNARKGT